MTAVTSEDVDFYMVWTKKGRPPRFMHKSYDAAADEAARLAALNPGKKFIVLHGVTKHHLPVEGA